MKEEKTIMVLRKMTESEIKNLGGNYMIKKRWKYWLGLALLSLLWLAVIPYTIKGGSIVVFLISIVPVLLVTVAWAYSFSKAGKKLWYAIKDREQPVKLGF